jgi:hypothetical protein
MRRPPASNASFPLAAFLASLVSALLVLGSMLGAEAQQRPKEASSATQNGRSAPRDQPEIGFYSLTLSDIWGPAKMPPPPMDFGPHFDFPPEPLNGAPLHDPYPN